MDLEKWKHGPLKSKGADEAEEENKNENQDELLDEIDDDD